MPYPTDIIEKAKYETHTFERVSRKTGDELIAELTAWRARFHDYVYRPQDDCVALKFDKK